MCERCNVKLLSSHSAHHCKHGTGIAILTVMHRYVVKAAEDMCNAEDCILADSCSGCRMQCCRLYQLQDSQLQTLRRQRAWLPVFQPHLSRLQCSWLQLSRLQNALEQSAQPQVIKAVRCMAANVKPAGSWHNTSCTVKFLMLSWLRKLHVLYLCLLCL